ncbi:MAG: FAD:protein FMN transferase [Peptoniphilaceae bacterium]|nr:FAD:protein FMN transferase [Peptoniphilaceae bacterium]MDD7383568.1 FAD:protein FMN transferase [Peptoniphilaceae bacterium]MDY3738741.1 FAD:protein FMN transferase [Peptoniphilaceae bacterium]
MFKKLLIIFCILIFTSCSSNDNQKIDTNLVKNEKQVFDTFDTVIMFTAYTKDKKEFDKYEKILEEDFKYYSKLFDNFKSYDGMNNVFTVNLNAWNKNIKVSPEIIDILEISKEWYKKTNGDFNVAEGSVIRIWYNFREEALKNPKNASIPKIEDLKKASEKTDIDNVAIDKEKNEISLKNQYTQIDLGAVAKGYAVEKIREKLKSEGLEHGIISAGGNVVTIGKNPTRKDGKRVIGVQNPNTNENKLASIIKVGETSIVTSGDYQRYFEVDGKRYNHIIDPKTLMPAENFTSVTVIIDDSTIADIMSTTLFIKNYEDGKKLAENIGAKVLWIDKSFNQKHIGDIEFEKQ